MITALLIIHGLLAVALLGGVTHQTVSAWSPARKAAGSFVNRFRSVTAAIYTNAIVVLYIITMIVGAAIILNFVFQSVVCWKNSTHRLRWALSSSKNILPSSASHCCRLTGFSGDCPWLEEHGRTRKSSRRCLRSLSGGIFVGHVVNNLRGFGA